MAFFKLAKKKKDESLDMPIPGPELEQPPPSSPTEQAMMMKQQGYTNSQITQVLQGQGYNNSQISDAIGQSSLGATMQNAPMESGMSDYGQSFEQQPYGEPPPQVQPQSFQPPREMQGPVSVDEERVQEVAEAIIDEKWKEFAGDMRRVIEWKERSEDRIAKMEQQMLDVRMSIDSLTKSIMSKISGYDQNIVDVGTEIKAMEKVFQKVLPTLTENVNKLDRMAKGYKDAGLKK